MYFFKSLEDLNLSLVTYGMEQWTSSPRIHPVAHMSTAVSYWFSTKMSSGARYHLEATWSVNSLGRLIGAADSRISVISSLNSYSYSDLSSILKSRSFFLRTFLRSWGLSLSDEVLSDLARPKSQIFTEQVLSISRFAGFRSLWIMLAEWRNFMAQSMLYKMVMMCCSSSMVPISTEDSTFLTSQSTKSITRNIMFKSRLFSRWPLSLKLALSNSSLKKWFVFFSSFFGDWIYSIEELSNLSFSPCCCWIVWSFWPMITSYSFVVNKLPFIFESFLRMPTSLTIFLAEYWSLKVFLTNFIANCFPLFLWVAFLTYPKLPSPSTSCSS